MGAPSQAAPTPASSRIYNPLEFADVRPPIPSINPCGEISAGITDNLPVLTTEEKEYKDMSDFIEDFLTKGYR